MLSSTESKFRLARFVLYLIILSFSICSLLPVYAGVSWLRVTGSDHVFEIKVNCGGDEVVGKYTVKYDMGTRRMMVESDFSQGILFVPDGCKESVNGFRSSITWHYDDYSLEYNWEPFQDWLKNCKDKGMTSFVLMIFGVMAVLLGVIYRSYCVFSGERPFMKVIILAHFIAALFLVAAVASYKGGAIDWENEATMAHESLEFNVQGGPGWWLALFSVVSLFILVIVDVVVAVMFPDVKVTRDEKSVSLQKNDSLDDIKVTKPNVTFNANRRALQVKTQHEALDGDVTNSGYSSGYSVGNGIGGQSSDNNPFD